MFLCQNMNEKHQYGVDTLENIPSCTISGWIHRKYQSLFINSQRLKPEGGRPPCQISTCNALICLKHVCMNHWIRSGQKHGKVCGLSVESKWHGWSVRQRGGGGQLQQTFAWDSKLVAWIVEVSTQPAFPNFHWKAFVEDGKVVDFWKLWNTSCLAWNDTASGCPCCGTCFLSWDPKARAILREGFFYIQATPSLLGNCAHIPVISFWHQSYQLSFV